MRILTVLFLAATVAAQTTRDGFAKSSLHLNQTVAWTVRGFAVGLDPGQTFVAVGSQILRVDSRSRQTVIRSLTATSTAGLITRPPRSRELFYTDFATNLLYRHNLETGAEQVLPVPKNAFDLALDPGGRMLVSANPLWPDPRATTGVWLVVDDDGSHRELIRLSGPSGPIAMDRDDDLWCAVLSPVFPQPPGGVRLMRFDWADVLRAIRGGPRLSERDGHVVASIDGAFDLAIDDRGRVCWSDAIRGTIHRMLPGNTQVDPTPLLSGAVAAVSLQFEGDSARTFDPYQPAWSEVLFAATTDWTGTYQVWSIVPSRPRLLSIPDGPVSPGPLTIRLKRLPANAPAVVWMHLGRGVAERAIFDWNGVPIWLGLDLGQPLLSTPLMADSAGRANLQLQYPGGAPAETTWQAGVLLFGPPGLATSNPLALRLR